MFNKNIIKNICYFLFGFSSAMFIASLVVNTIPIGLLVLLSLVIIYIVNTVST